MERRERGVDASSRAFTNPAEAREHPYVSEARNLEHPLHFDAIEPLLERSREAIELVVVEDAERIPRVDEQRERLVARDADARQQPVRPDYPGHQGRAERPAQRPQ